MRLKCNQIVPHFNFKLEWVWAVTSVGKYNYGKLQIHILMHKGIPFQHQKAKDLAKLALNFSKTNCAPLSPKISRLQMIFQKMKVLQLKVSNQNKHRNAHSANIYTYAYALC